ncbi:choice-of-anchor G family protein [Corynebacterium sp. YIM 101645]|uniref:Choice-of-anchor G family protein n=2 Tax=Corynebacterium lemuris TaxID=1859292 RepID=A0ABT2G2J0_9CORY|nr:choice-of-anchor G family protein [Corynebacterium lemuris]MCS5480502.1 choice-of-anchor G family protein [Corynebacterium lemuris]
MKTKIRRTLATALSVFLVAGVVLPVQTNAQESPYDPATHLDNTYSYAYGGLLDLRLLNQWLTIGPNGDALSATDLRGVDQLWETVLDNDKNVAASSLDVEALELIYLNLGQISLPLLGQGGLLEFVLNDASVGTLREYAYVPSAAHAHGAAGVVSDSGGLELTQPGEGKSSSIDILSLLALGNSTVITENIIDTAALELGAISAVAINPDDSDFSNYEVTCAHPLTATDIGTDAAVAEVVCHGYQVADAILVLDVPLIDTLMGDITSLFDGLNTTINDALGEDSLFNSLLRTLTNLIRAVPLVGLLVNLDLEVTAKVPVNIVTDLLNHELSDADGLVKIDLKNGLIKVDLKQLHTGNLNSLEANTNLLTPDNINAITASVLSLLTDDADTNKNGLMAHLESLLLGDRASQTGGLYETSVSIILKSSGLLGGVGSLEISGTLSQLFNGGFTYEGTGLLYLVEILGAILNPLTGGVGELLEEILFNGPTSVVSTLIGSATDAVLSQIVGILDPVLEEVLKPLANIIINRQFTTEETHGTVFTVSALEVNVGDLNTSGELVHLPLATASVMAQPPVKMDIDVAKIGDGRNLHTGGYAYDLLCTIGTEENRQEVLNKTGLQYDGINLGEGFFLEADELSLSGAVGGIEPVRITPGAECTVTAISPKLNETHEALRPTGHEPGIRTPYTYFLDVDKTNGVRVSGETPADGPTAMHPIGMAEEGPVNVDTTTIGAEWKHRAFTFIVPPGEKTHKVNIVHAYDIDRRDIVLSKSVSGPAPGEENYNFEYSLDGGKTWLPHVTNSPISIPTDSSFTIKDVPVLNLEALNAEPSTQVPAQVMIRERLGTESQHVRWMLENSSLPSFYPQETDGAFKYATTTFAAGPVITPDVVPTPNQNLGITNFYAAIEVDKHIDGLLDGIGETTLLPSGEGSMAISYTVKNIGAVELDAIKIYDPSLVNDLFTLPADITVGPGTGEVTGCTLVFGPNGEDATCSFEVSFTNPEAPFHYEADTSEVTAEATTIIEGRTITATATDKHGAMRLSNILGQLPATGVTTLVSVLALGLIAALGALALYVRSRRK